VALSSEQRAQLEANLAQGVGQEREYHFVTCNCADYVEGRLREVGVSLPEGGTVPVPHTEFEWHSPTIDTPIIAQQLEPVEEEPFEITDQEDLQIHFDYDSSLNKIVIAFNFQYMAGTNISIMITNYSTIVQKYSDVMGWDYNNVNIPQYFPSGTAYDLPDQVELLKTKNIYLRTSNILTTNIASQDLQRGTIFARIPLDVEYGSVLYYKSSTSRPSKLESKILKDFRFQLVDDSFNLINFIYHLFIIVVI
jgi:hypothetical protein